MRRPAASLAGDHAILEMHKQTERLSLSPERGREVTTWIYRSERAMRRFRPWSCRPSSSRLFEGAVGGRTLVGFSDPENQASRTFSPHGPFGPWPRSNVTACPTFAVGSETFRVSLTTEEQVNAARAAQTGAAARIPDRRIVAGSQTNTGWRLDHLPGSRGVRHRSASDDEGALAL